MKKRIISLLLVTCMVLSTFVGCGKKEDETNAEGGSGKLTVGIPQNANVTSYDENGFTEYLEKELGIDIQFKYFSSSWSEYQKQITLMCTSGEKLPDVLWGFLGIDRYTASEFGEDGYFQDLTELLDKYGENYKAAMSKLSKEEQETIVKMGTSPVDNGFYGMPYYTSMDVIDTIANMMYINQSWLDKVGMKAPTNVDELYAVLKAFKEKDPNGNGQADEIPMLSQNIEDYIINAYVYLGSYGFNVTEGKVWNPYISNEYRQALQFCNKLCKEGLLSDMNFTLTSQAEYIALITPSNDVARVGIWCGHPQLLTSTTTSILDEYVALAPLTDKTGKGGYLVNNPSDLMYCSFVTSDCKDVKTAMKFLDFFYKDETTTRMRHGVKDQDWVYEDGTNDYGNPSKIKILDANAVFQGNSNWGTLGHMIATEENYLTKVADGMSARNMEVGRLAAESYKILMTAKQPAEKLEYLVYTVAEHEQRSKLSTLYNQYISESTALFITGEMNPDSDADWNTYLKEVAGLGEETLLNIAQSAYDRDK